MEFLASIWFRYLIFPLGTVIAGVAIKYVSQNDRFENFKKEDLAIGLELILTAVLMYVVLTTDRAVELVEMHNHLSDILQSSQVDATEIVKIQNEISTLTIGIGTAGWVIFLMLVGIWSISTVVRKWGWRGVDDMHPFIGIGIPLMFGVLALILVMVEAAR